MTGPAARKVMTGDIIVIMSYAMMDFEEAKKYTPKVIFPKDGNKI